MRSDSSFESSTMRFVNLRDQRGHAMNFMSVYCPTYSRFTNNDLKPVTGCVLMTGLVDEGHLNFDE